jgi:hypothetical protein
MITTSPRCYMIGTSIGVTKQQYKSLFYIQFYLVAFIISPSLTYLSDSNPFCCSVDSLHSRSTRPTSVKTNRFNNHKSRSTSMQTTITTPQPKRCFTMIKCSYFFFYSWRFNQIRRVITKQNSYRGLERH